MVDDLLVVEEVGRLGKELPRVGVIRVSQREGLHIHHTVDGLQGVNDALVILGSSRYFGQELVLRQLHAFAHFNHVFLFRSFGSTRAIVIIVTTRYHYHAHGCYCNTAHHHLLFNYS